MIAPKTYPGLWADVILDPVSGLTCLVYQRPDYVICCVDEHGVERWRVPVGLEWHQLRACVNADGEVLVCACGHDDRLWWLVRNRSGKTRVFTNGNAFGQNAVACAVSSWGWEIAVMRSATSYGQVHLYDEGDARDATITVSCSATSQGFLGWANGPIFLDGNRYHTDPRTSQVLHCPSRVGDITVGQDGPSNHVLAAHPDRLYRVWPADGFEARVVARPSGGYAVCVRALRQTVALVIVTEPYPADEWAQPAPVPNKPAPTPAPVEEPMSINHLDTVIAERAKYGTPLGKEGAHRVINAVAWTHRAEGLGLLKAPAGVDAEFNGCRLDIIVCKRTRQAWDVLYASDVAGKPIWDVIDYGADFDARWVAPYQPADAQPDPVDPPIPPQPDTPPVTPPTQPVETRLERSITAFCRAWLGV